MYKTSRLGTRELAFRSDGNPMTYEELLKLASEKSDHGDRVVELKPAIEEAIRNTSPEYPALEIGNREGGSALLILAHLGKEGKHRELITADVNDCAKIVAERAGNLSIPYRHFKGTQEDFVKNNAMTFGFVYLDADHVQTNVVRDIGILIPRLAKGAIVAVDDVEDWGELPSFEGLERIEYAVDEGNKLGVHGHHAAFYRKL